MNLGCQPKIFRKSLIIATCKPAKGDYSQAKSYRCRASVDIPGKMLEAIIATRIGYLTNAHQMHQLKGSSAVEDRILII